MFKLTVVAALLPFATTGAALLINASFAVNAQFSMWAGGFVVTLAALLLLRKPQHKQE